MRLGGKRRCGIISSSASGELDRSSYFGRRKEGRKEGIQCYQHFTSIATHSIAQIRIVFATRQDVVCYS